MSHSTNRMWSKLLAFAAIFLLGLVISATNLDASGMDAQATQQRCWASPTVAPTGGQFSILRAVAPTSDKDVWAVGFYTTPDSPLNSPLSRPLLEHWDGSIWTQIPLLRDADTDSVELNGVAALSSDNVWVVGWRRTSIPQTFIMHYNGRDWTVVPSPSPGQGFNRLNGIATITPDDIWAVGAYGDPRPEAGANSSLTLILHWDGLNWTQTPAPGLWGLEAVVALASDNLWAVGGNTIAHWDGKGWSDFPWRSPSDNAYYTFHSIAALTPDDMWVVGEWGRGVVTLHWDGRTFKRVQGVGQGLISKLYGVAMVSSDDVWAVGEYRAEYVPEGGDSLSGYGPLLAHWDGSVWSLAPLPLTTTVGGELLATAVTGETGQVWTVGYSFIARDGKHYMNGLTLSGASAPCKRKPFGPPLSLPGWEEEERLFPETAGSIKGIFRKYWEENGGLSQFGYPISGEIGEVSDLNGKLYTVQYFERAVIEYHPEYNTIPPFGVLLSQLGTLQYRAKYPGGAPAQTPNTTAGSVLFAETEKRLGGLFLKYWQQNGGVMQQGYPISDEFVEVSNLDGKPYTVQYFERAVFERHPENQPPYNILLSQLGKVRYDRLYDTVLSP